MSALLLRLLAAAYYQPGPHAPAAGRAVAVGSSGRPGCVGCPPEPGLDRGPDFLPGPALATAAAGIGALNCDNRRAVGASRSIDWADFVPAPLDTLLRRAFWFRDTDDRRTHRPQGSCDQTCWRLA